MQLFANPANEPNPADQQNKDEKQDQKWHWNCKRSRILISLRDLVIHFFTQITTNL